MKHTFGNQISSSFGTAANSFIVHDGGNDSSRGFDDGDYGGPGEFISLELGGKTGSTTPGETKYQDDRTSAPRCPDCDDGAAPE